MNNLTCLTQVGESSVLLLKATGNDAEPDEALHKVDELISNYHDAKHMNASEFDSWFSNLLKPFNDNVKASSHYEAVSYYSMQNLFSTNSEMSINHM